MVLAAAAAVAWGYTAPERSLEQLRSAARSGDPARLESVIDFPALRGDVQAQVSSELEERAARPGNGALGSLAQALGDRILEPMIDRLVSPAVIADLVSSDAGSADDGVPDHKVQWISPSAFQIRFIEADGSEGSWLEFHRQGINWRVVAAGLPPDLISGR
ncbi:MAG: DUF2939 domain-containing protein [Gemmatimonadota bacterium]|jgi:hypothetical protein|nr:DUF2939 domain-containing protein [Gemmatimonadota bacterium]